MESVIEKNTTETSSKNTSDHKIYPKQCPICGVDTNYVSRIHETRIGEEAFWYHCTCGVVFQESYPSHSAYDKTYLEYYQTAKQNDLRMTHASRIYAPLIEELTYGRMMLDVGYCLPYNLRYFEDRGWLVWGIDTNEAGKYGGNLYRGDFMTYDFSPNITDDKLKDFIGEKNIKRTFDLIWMNHVFEHFNDPLAALKRAYNLLSDDGVLFIATPDIDFIAKTGAANWTHWRKHEHYVMWTERALVRELERIGFHVVLKRRNFASRFISWYDIHCIAQKNYF